MGPASSGKTWIAAALAYTDLMIWPEGTSIIMSSTTREGLQLRIWGAIKEHYNKARQRRPWLPGKVIESRYMLTTSQDFSDEDDAKDFRDGIVGVACKVGGTWVGLSNYVGLKNDRVRLFADESSLMGRGFLDSLSNLRKNPSFKLMAMGNPKDPTDALGVICEPNSEMGGWEGLPYEEKTRTWKTRYKGGLAIQLCGYDSPNYRYPRGLNPFRGLITPEMIEADLEYYGKDSLQFSMMNLGCMPKDSGIRRVITVSLCEKNLAFEDPVWMSSREIIRVTGLDAAYSGVGGDRCVLTDLSFGPDLEGKIILSFTTDQIIVPVTVSGQAEEQIAEFVRDYHERNNIPPENHGFDSTGRGTLMSAYARLWSPAVVPIEFGGKPSSERRVSESDDRTERDAYGKMVTALWFATRLIIEAGQFRKMPRECAREGSLREWTITKQVREHVQIDVEPKHKTKERMGRSPDLFDSCVTAVEMARRRGFSIAGVKGFGIVHRKNPDWVSMARDRFSTLRRKSELSFN